MDKLIENGPISSNILSFCRKKKKGMLYSFHELWEEWDGFYFRVLRFGLRIPSFLKNMLIVWLLALFLGVWRMFSNEFNCSMITHEYSLLICSPFCQNLLAHSRRGRQKHALLPDSFKFTAQNINLNSERQYIYGKKTSPWRKTVEAWACICFSIFSLSRETGNTAKSSNIVNWWN